VIRSRKAAAMLHGFRTLTVLGTTSAALAVTTGLADAAPAHTDVTVVQDGVSASAVSDALPGEVGIAAVLAGGVGLVIGLLRRHRRSVVRRAAERAAARAAARVAPARTS
jgi:hypothetical protein